MKRALTKLLALVFAALLMVQGIGDIGIFAASKTVGTPKITVSVTKKKAVKISIDKTKGASWYVIEMKAPGNSKFKKLKKISKDGTAKRSFTKKGLADGEYTFRVRAFAKNGKKTLKSSYSEEKTIYLGELPEIGIIQIDLSKYESYGYGFGGVIPVSIDGAWGAIDYTGKEIVPCEYVSFKSANNAGYFILFDEDWNYCLFDKTGKLVTKVSSENLASLTAASEGYIVTSDNSGTSDYQTRYEFYNYKGKLLKTIDSGYGEGFGLGEIYDDPKGYFDGKSIVTGNIKERVYKKEKDNTISSYRPFDFGLVDKNGKVTWIDGDGIDETAKGYMSYEEFSKDTSLAGLEKEINTMVEYAMNAPVDGYFLSHSMFGSEWPGYYLRDLKGNIICSIIPEQFTFDGDKLVYEVKDKDTYGRTSNFYTGKEVYYRSELMKYFYDGNYYYNYGNKIVIRDRDGEKYALISLDKNGISYKIFDYIERSNNKYWLVSKDGKTGYCDHDGNIVALFDDATSFVNGYALVVENGISWFIDENLKKIQMFAPAKSVFVGGEIFEIQIDDNVKFDFTIKKISELLQS